MPTGEELEELITQQIDKDSVEMIELMRGGVIHGRKTESPEIMGAVGECCRTGCVSGQDVRKG